MQTKIYVLSKLEFKDILEQNSITDNNVNEFFKIAFISINDSNGSFYNKPLFEQEHSNVLTLWFDDVEKDGQISPTNKEFTKAFTNEQAKSILEFLKINKNAETFLVHCAAGISRSGAVGQFILDYLKGDKDFFNIKNRHILPNGRVLRMLNEQARK